ncbi:MAG TPA: phosphodiesterase [Casimicrobiaceae bacterium]|jgi:Icc protein|nr:phosphodiesterase [Casimicrobiaceae bacterium]
MKLIHITDTHLVRPGKLLFGLDPHARLTACIDDVLAHHADAALCVITGDLAHRGESAAYETLATELARLPMPVFPLVGNHDARAPFRAAFPAAVRDPQGFVQGVVRRDEGDFILLDTLDEGVHGGRYCDARSAWLAARLDEAAGRPVYLFMHHPPFAVGIDWLDEIALAEPERFATLVAGHRNIRHLFYGHVHRPVCGSWHGIPVSTMRGTNHQVPFDLGPRLEELPSHEPPAYGVVLIEPDRVVVHFHDYLDRRRLVEVDGGYAYAR